MSECKTNSKVSSNQIANYGNFHNSIKRTKTNYDEKLYKTSSSNFEKKVIENTQNKRNDYDSKDEFINTKTDSIFSSDNKSMMKNELHNNKTSNKPIHSQKLAYMKSLRTNVSLTQNEAIAICVQNNIFSLNPSKNEGRNYQFDRRESANSIASSSTSYKQSSTYFNNSGLLYKSKFSHGSNKAIVPQNSNGKLYVKASNIKNKEQLKDNKQVRVNFKQKCKYNR